MHDEACIQLTRSVEMTASPQRVARAVGVLVAAATGIFAVGLIIGFVVVHIAAHARCASAPRLDIRSDGIVAGSSATMMASKSSGEPGRSIGRRLRAPSGLGCSARYAASCGERAAAITLCLRRTMVICQMRLPNLHWSCDKTAVVQS